MEIVHQQLEVGHEDPFALRMPMPDVVVSPHHRAAIAERRGHVLVAPDVLAIAVDEDDDPLRVVTVPRADVELAHQPSTISAAARAVAASPATSSVVTIDSRHGSRSWRILSGGPISESRSISSCGIAAAASSFLPSR